MQIAMVVYPGMTALDLIGPYEVLRFVPDAEIRFVWSEPGPVIADSGVLVLAATHSFDETPAPDIVVIGGSGTATATISKNRQLLDWLRRVHETTLWTASVCTGSIVLASAGLLEGLPATTHWSQLPVLDGLGAKAIDDQRIVHTGKIVTGAGVSAGIDLALWLVGQVAGDDVARAAQLVIEYDPRPPYDSGSLAKAGAATKRAVAAIIGREAVKLAAAEPGALLRESVGLSQLAWKTVLHKVRRRTPSSRTTLR
ncbi:DJ-1/PfpI family protein [Nocardia otitidiscaviarum]|uniref:DJ-1/PfpI family protein n=1 Tax=Nocardia otitidiscaviarum TaxID=1823 RepID=UPI0004A6F26F|nr:DJ-1/PfpI family protein [Nocardia otitidiscaviarum]MBF6135039.1 DJ-1/PfpI family protein [Nocardia otitidiscaviarum]MBF6486862.1 DJ-1/PfpI family protein [Nocardia otitidiscaviarum]